MKIRNVVLAILTPAIIILANFSILAFSKEYYEKQYEKNGVYTKIPEEQLNEATTQLINYLRYGKELQGDYFNGKEKEHLRDVRSIIKNLMILLYTSIILAAIIIIMGLAKDRRNLGRALIAGGLITTLLIVVLSLSLTNFEYTFLKFHEISFSNDLWMLNPETDRLIVMFPETFFYEITKNIAIGSFLTGLLTIATGVMVTRLNKKFI